MTERNADVSKTLTEQWKKGELRDGVYYIKTTQGFIITDYFADNWDFLQEEQVERILAKVPSYEEYEGLLSKLELQQTSYDFDTARLEEENTKLKKQLAHVTKTQAKQFRDNQKLQVKAEHAKDVVNIDTARQIKQLKDLLKECRERLIYCTISTRDVQAKINQVLGE